MLLSYTNFLAYIHAPTHPASLAFTRFLFGLLMLLDIPDERGGADLDLRWGDPQTCYFPLFAQLKRLPFAWMCLLYGIMWLGALGISVGYKFRTSCLAFSIPYWYLLLLDKSFWNNHSYLYGLLALLFLVSSAGKFWSLDAILKPAAQTNTAADIFVPKWNYLIIKFQIFILYFMAGVKKTDMEWLEGYSMSLLGEHWIFKPFTLFLTADQIDLLVVHGCGFLLDISAGFLLMCRKTRLIAILLCTMFHLMNTRLFSIGMFPYVCIATLPIFCDPEWPCWMLNKLNYHCKPATNKISNKSKSSNRKFKIKFTLKHHLSALFFGIHILLQLFLPFSHFLTKGYNNWTNGLYGYSWDMMIHSWDTTLIVIRIVDNNSGKEHFLDPSAWTYNSRWSKHADMCVQYAQCLKTNLLTHHHHHNDNTNNDAMTSDNLSIYIDVWCSLNRRFHQRMFDPNYDLLKAKWTPFSQIEWLLPLLTEYSDLRTKMREIEQHVYSWSNYSEVLFFADFPGLSLENHIMNELDNITLTIIEGEVLFYQHDFDSIKLRKGESSPIVTKGFHTIFTTGATPSCFMYTYTNRTRETLKLTTNNQMQNERAKSPLPIFEDGGRTFEHFSRMIYMIANSFLNILYDVPMIIRTKE